MLPGVSTDTLPSNGHLTLVMRLSGKIFVSLRSNESIRHNIIMIIIKINFTGPLMLYFY
jgi:hypothetical protein